MARKRLVVSACCWRGVGIGMLTVGTAGDVGGVRGGLPFLHHLRTSLTFDTTMSLALEEE